MPKNHRSISRLTTWAIVASVVSFGSSLVLFVAEFDQGYYARQPTPVYPFHRPNPYVNLDNVAGANAHDYLDTFSQVVLQIHNSDPTRKMTEDHRTHWTEEGTVYPEDRHIVVVSLTSSIVQFRVADSGMEKCVLNAVLPKPTKWLDPAIHVQNSSVIDIWMVESSTEITPYVSTSWTYAPERRNRFSTWVVFDSDSEWSSHSFWCKSQTFVTFELACSEATPNCHVEFWQDREGPNGVYLQQSPSLRGLSA